LATVINAIGFDYLKGGPNMKALLLAGGKGTRLHPLTINQPKPMIPVLDRPWLEYLVKSLKDYGIREIIFSLCHHSERIMDHFGHGEEYGIKARYVIEQSPLGTGGAVKAAEHYMDGDFLVINADIVTKLDLARLVSFHKRNNALCTLTLTKVSNPAAYGLVELGEDARIRSFTEKPQLSSGTPAWINAGIYLFNNRIFNYIPKDQAVSIERETFPRLLAEGERLFGFQSENYWLDLGTPQRYLKLHHDLISGRFQPAFPLERDKGKLWIHPTAKISPKAKLTAPCYIGAGSRIEAGAQIGPLAVIGKKVIVKRGSVIRSSVLWKGAKVGENTRLEQAIVGYSTRISDNHSLVSQAIAE
jgi:mannose-1-phosphate guanylyltransferase